jgi:hypothetical protein
VVFDLHQENPALLDSSCIVIYNCAHCITINHQQSYALYLYFTVSINWKDGEPVISTVVRVKILSFDGYFAKNFILFQVAVPIVHIHRQVTKPTWDLKLELLSKKWAGNTQKSFQNYVISTTEDHKILVFTVKVAKPLAKEPKIPQCLLVELRA